MFQLFRKKPAKFLSDSDQQIIVEAISKAEKRTSGEIRIYIEATCSYMDPVIRAKEIFEQLKMHQTASRNGVLLYFAVQDRQLAIFGDEGIHQKVGTAFWESEIQLMIAEFRNQHFVAGTLKTIHDIGEALVKHFPYNQDSDENELPNDIVFG